jgi:hypothetical protein
MNIAPESSPFGVAALVLLLGFSVPAVTSQINSICRADDQTFKAKAFEI